MAKKRDKSTITLGSGKLYVMEYDENTHGTAFPKDNVIEAESNRLGSIKGGASIEYAPEFYEVKDDLGEVSQIAVTKEDVTMKTGILTWNGEVLEKLCQTGRISTVEQQRVLKIGGINNQNGKKYIIRFLHENKANGNVRVTIVGQNRTGFQLAFKQGEETVIDAEFKAMPNLDKEGTLVIVSEEIQ